MKNLLSTYKCLPREIYILFIGKIVNFLGAFVQQLMSLILTQKLGMSAGQAGEFVTIMALCQVPCIIIGEKLTDTIGRKKVITIFQSLGILMLIICGMISLSITTVKFMILSSCFYSMSMPAYDALNADLTNESNRKNSYSLLYMGVNIGFFIGPIIGGFLYKDYLHMFDVLKSEGVKFVDAIGINNGNCVLKHVIDLGKTLDMEVVVEGVETKEQYEFLKQNGCDTIQGYYFSKPLDSKSFEKLLTNINFN